MRKVLFGFMALFCVIGLFSGCGKKYDPVKVQATMHDLKSAIMDAHKYGNPITTDFEKAKDAFSRLEKAFLSLKGTMAPKGDQKEWDFIHEQCVISAQKAVKACDAKDKKAIGESLVDIDAAMMKGHTRFK